MPQRRFDVIVVSDPTGDVSVPESAASPVARHRVTQPFASIPEDHALDDNATAPAQHNHFLQHGASSSRSNSPAPDWDFSQDESSDSVSN